MIRRYRLLVGDCLTSLRALPAESVQCCVTSPPYFNLRDYQVEGQIGLEPTPAEYVAKMVEVFREVRRVLRDDGTLWLNLGDSYAGSWGNQGRKEERGTQRPINGPMMQNLEPYPETQSNTGKIPDGSGLKPKDLIGIPWSVAFALRDDGWWLRSDNIWAKPNPMPSSVEDRTTPSHEYLFMLAKSERYFYDADAIREPHAAASLARYEYGLHMSDDASLLHSSPRKRILEGIGNSDRMGDFINPAGRNKRTVWTIATQPYPGSHFAVMPEALVEPCVLAGTSERGACAKCGEPWMRDVIEAADPRAPKPYSGAGPKAAAFGQAQNESPKVAYEGGGSALPSKHRSTVGWAPTCDCAEQTTRPCVVLDPFAGSGTVGVVALRHSREFIGCELNPKYAQLARERIQGDAPLFNREGEAA